VEKVQGVSWEDAVGVELEVGLGIRNSGRWIVLPLVNPGEKNVGVCFAGVELKGFQCAVFGLGDVAERKLHECKTVFAYAGSGGHEETSLNEGFSLAEIRSPIKDHRKPEQRRCKTAVGQVDRFLEFLRGGVKLTKAIECKAKVVVGTIGGRNLFDDRAEVREAGFDIAFEKETSSLFEGARGFVGHGEFLNGDDGIVARRGRGSGSAQTKDERLGKGKAGGELERFASGSGDGDAIGRGRELGNVELAIVIGEGGYGGTGVLQKEFHAGVANGAAVAGQKNGALGGSGGVLEGRRLRERRDR
jgi:hypothetical protein